MQRLDGSPQRNLAAVVAAALCPSQMNVQGGWAQLPVPLLHAAFALLPLDARLHAAGVCTDWRAAAAAQDWSRLRFKGCALPVSDKLFLAASRRAGHAAVLLELPACPDRISYVVLLEVLRANAATLSEVGLGDEYYSDAALTELMETVPHVRVLVANMSCRSHERTGAMLRKEPPYAALFLRKLWLYIEHGHDVLMLMNAAAIQASLRKLYTMHSGFETYGTLDAVVDVAVSLGLSELTISFTVGLLAGAATALPRLLQSEALTALAIMGGPLKNAFDTVPACLPQLGAALRANRTLTALSLESVGLWKDGHDTTALFAALQSHPSLRSISLGRDRVPAAMAVAVGSALGALIAANAPALESLSIVNCQLGDAGMGPVLAALSRNTHLRVLYINHNSMTEPVMRAHLLPALQTCAGVHTIRSPYAVLPFHSDRLSVSQPGIGQELEQLLSPRRPAKATR